MKRSFNPGIVVEMRLSFSLGVYHPDREEINGQLQKR